MDDFITVLNTLDTADILPDISFSRAAVMISKGKRLISFGRVFSYICIITQYINLTYHHNIQVYMVHFLKLRF